MQKLTKKQRWICKHIKNLYRVCPESKVSYLILKRLYVEARSNWLRLIMGEVRFRTRDRSIISDHPESNDRLFHETRFRIHGRSNAALVGTKGCHQFNDRTIVQLLFLKTMYISVYYMCLFTRTVETFKCSCYLNNRWSGELLSQKSPHTQPQSTTQQQQLTPLHTEFNTAATLLNLFL